MLAFPPPLCTPPAPAAHSPAVRRRTSERRWYRAGVATRLCTTLPTRPKPPSPLSARPPAGPASHSPAVRRRTSERRAYRPRAASRIGATHLVRRRTSERRGQGMFVLGPTPRRTAGGVRGCPRAARQRGRQHPNPPARGARGGTFRRRYGARCGAGTVEPVATGTRSPASPVALPTCCKSTTSGRWRRAAATTLPTCVSVARFITDGGTRAAPATAPLQPRRAVGLADMWV